MKRIYMMMIMSMLALTGWGRQPERGYRGFVDGSMTFHIETSLYGSKSHEWLGAQTSHGYQFNPHLFVGAGIGYEALLNNGSSRQKRIFPVFADVRSDWKFGKFTPFIDAKLGANFTKGTGLYFSPSIGYRFNWGTKMAVNLAVGASFFGWHEEGYKVDDFDWGDYSRRGGVDNEDGSGNRLAIKPTVRLGIEF